MELFFILLFGLTYLILCFYLIRTNTGGEHYTKILSGVVLLLLIWIANGDAPFGPKLGLTFIAISGIWNGYISLKKSNRVTL